MVPGGADLSHVEERGMVQEQIYQQRTEAWFQGEHDLSYAEDRGMVPGGA
jgi:hypothetical protein